MVVLNFIEGTLPTMYIISTMENALFKGRIGKPKVAICSECGEVSIYVEDVDKLKYIPVTRELGKSDV
jgi:hypothetical protein